MNNDEKFFGNPGYLKNNNTVSHSVQEKQKQKIARPYNDTAGEEIADDQDLQDINEDVNGNDRNVIDQSNDFDEIDAREQEQEERTLEYDTKFENNFSSHPIVYGVAEVENNSKTRFSTNFQHRNQHQQRQNQQFPIQYQQSSAPATHHPYAKNTPPPLSLVGRQSTATNRRPSTNSANQHIDVVRQRGSNDAISVDEQYFTQTQPPPPPRSGKLKSNVSKKCKLCRCTIQYTIIIILLFIVAGSIMWTSILSGRINDAVKANNQQYPLAAKEKSLAVTNVDRETIVGGIVESDAAASIPTSTYHALQHFEFTTNDQVQTFQRYPESGGIEGLEDITKIDFFQVCCVNTKQSLVCARGVSSYGSYTIDAVIKCSLEKNECYLDVWVSNVDLTRLKCKLSYVLEET